MSERKARDPCWMNEGPKESSYFESIFLHGSVPTDPVATGLGRGRGRSRSRKGEGQSPVPEGDGGLRREEFKLQPSTRDIISPPSSCPVALLGPQPILADFSAGPYPIGSKCGVRRGCRGGYGKPDSARGDLAQALSHPDSRPRSAHARSDRLFHLLRQALRHSVRCCEGQAQPGQRNIKSWGSGKG